MFAEKKGGVLSVYLTAGYPGLEDTIPAIRALEKAGVDMIEIGMPFSDPLADGRRRDSQPLGGGLERSLADREFQRLKRFEVRDVRQC